MKLVLMKTFSIFQPHKSKRAFAISFIYYFFNSPMLHEGPWRTCSLTESIYQCHLSWSCWSLFCGVGHGISLPKLSLLSEGPMSFRAHREKGQTFLETLLTLHSPDVSPALRYLGLFDPCKCENPRGRIWKAQMPCLKYQSVNIINDLMLMPLYIQLNLCYMNCKKCLIQHSS